MAGKKVNDLLINKKAIRQFVLGHVDTMRLGWDCNRVADEYYKKIDAVLRNRIIKDIQRHPSIGKTFKECL